MFEDAKVALHEVLRINERLMRELDVDRFFYSVRPYYKPYRVGRQEYRGANAGDFSGINEIDLLLGVCRANDPYYAQLLVDKMLFMIPADQAAFARVHDAHELARRAAAASRASTRAADWFQRNAARLSRGLRSVWRYAAQHHDGLVQRFIAAPATALDDQGLRASPRAVRRCLC